MATSHIDFFTHLQTSNDGLASRLKRFTLVWYTSFVNLLLFIIYLSVSLSTCFCVRICVCVCVCVFRITYEKAFAYVKDSTEYYLSYTVRSENEKKNI